MEKDTETSEIKKRNSPINLLVIECSSNLNWYEKFNGRTFQGQAINVEQAEYEDISLVTYGDSNNCVVSLRPASRPLEGTTQNEARTIVVNFLLIRSVARGIHHQDCRNILYGFMHAGIPSVNSLEACLFSQERPVVFGALKKIQKKLGRDNFPLIEQNYYPNHNAILITPELPYVLKMGHAHAGYGKIKITEDETGKDVKSIAALHGDYITAEPFIEWDFDQRIQKIGDNYRAFQRQSPNWKGNVGNASIIEDIEVTEEYKLWIDEASKLLGGLDICALDLLTCQKTGKSYILELNDTAIGLVHKHEEQDMQFMVDLVLQKMEENFGEKNFSNLENQEKEDLIENLKKSEIKITRQNEDILSLKNEIENLKNQLQDKKNSNIFSNIFNKQQ